MKIRRKDKEPDGKKVEQLECVEPYRTWLILIDIMRLYNLQNWKINKSSKSLFGFYAVEERKSSNAMKNLQTTLADEKVNEWILKNECFVHIFVFNLTNH